MGEANGNYQKKLRNGCPRRGKRPGEKIDKTQEGEDFRKKGIRHNVN
jgi:hypothetical protein